MLKTDTELHELVLRMEKLTLTGNRQKINSYNQRSNAGNSETAKRKYRGNISRSRINDYFLKDTSKAKPGECGNIKLRNLCTAKKIINSVEWLQTEYEKIFVNYLPEKS